MMRATKRIGSAILGIAAVVALLALNLGSGGAQDPLGSFMSVSPAIDGTLNSAEWSDAASANFTLGDDYRQATLYVGNDAANLYLALVVQDPSDSGDYDALVVFFDNDAGGGEVRAAGDDGLQQTGDPEWHWFDDTFWWVPPSPEGISAVAVDTMIGQTYPGTEDGAGAAVHLDGQWTFELSHPLCSSDTLHDFCLSLGDIVGFSLRVLDDHVIVGDWPGDIDTPNAYGQIAIEAGAPPQLNDLTLTVAEQEIGAGAHTVPIADIPVESIPLLSSALAGTPLSSIGIETSPLSSIPLSSIPLSSISIAGVPLSSIPLSSIPLSSIGGWEAILAGTELQDVPLQFVTLQMVLALQPPPEGLEALTLADVGLASTALRGVSLASLALGSIPLSSIPLDWCTLLPDCSNLAGTTLMDLDIQGVPLSSIPLSSIPLSSIPITSSPLSSIPLSSIDIEDIPLSSIPLSSIPLSSIAIAGTPLSSIALDSISLPEGFTDWCDFLATFGSGFECGGSHGLSPSSQLYELALAILESGSDLSSSPLSSIPLSSIPLSSIPLSSIPLSSIPLSSIPLSSIPLSSIGVAGTPLSSIPLSSIALPDPFTNWCAFLATFPSGLECNGAYGLGPSSQLYELVQAIVNEGYDLASTPLSSIPLSSIPLSSIPLSSIPLSSIPLSSIPLSSIPLSSIPLSSIAVAGTPLSSIPLSSIDLPEGFADWCDFLASFGTEFTCTELGLDSASSLAELAQAILGAGFDLASSPLSSIPLSSIPLSSIPLSSIPLSSIGVAGTLLSSTPLSSIDPPGPPTDLCEYLNDFPGFTCAELGVTPNSTLYELVQAILDIPSDLSSSPLSSIPLSSIPLSSIPLSIFYGDILLGELGDDPDADLGGVTFGDILIALLLDSDLPWEQLPLDEMGVQLFAGTGETLHHHLSFSNIGAGPALGTEVSVGLPDGFLYKPNTTLLTIDPPGSTGPFDDPTVDGSLLTWALGTVDPGVIVELDFEVLAGLQLGIFSSSATVAAGNVYQSVDDQAPVRVKENFEPNNDPASAGPVLQPDVLYISHIGKGSDVDFFQIAVPPAGSRVAVLMSRLGSDNDLIMYKPAGAPLSSIPIIPVQDEGLGATNIANALPPQTLQDIALQSLPLSSISANRGTNDESVRAVSAGGSGFYTIQVSGYNGASSPDPYVLRVKVTPPPAIATCDKRDFPFPNETEDGGIAGTIPAIPDEVNTLFIVNQERLGDMYGATAANDVMAALNTLAGHSDLGINGTVIPVEGYPEVAAAYTAWDEDNPCSPYLANDVAKAIAARVNEIRAAYPSVRFVVVAGSDEIVPMARVPDLTQISNESDYAADLAFTGSNALSASVATANILTDDVYGDIDPIPWLDRELYVPEIAVGRLVETPGEIVAAVDNYIGFNGELDPQTALTTGYDFLSDGAEAVASELEAILGDDDGDGCVNDGCPAIADAETAVQCEGNNDDDGDGYVNDGCPAVGDAETGAECVDADVDRSLISETWTRKDLCDALGLGCGEGTATPDIASINAHYDHYRALPPAGESDLFKTADVARPPGDPQELPRRIIFSMGCHSGQSVADVLIAGPDERLFDWPQAYADQGAVYAANTGYGYGDTAAVALSERLMTLFAERLNGSMAVGEALTFAKQEYYGGLGIYGVYDEKALVEATFYGLPMYRVGPEAPPPQSPQPPPLKKDPMTGLQAAPIHAEPAVQTVVTPRGTFYQIDGKTQVTHYRPIQPRMEFDVTQPGTRAHGAIIIDLVSEDEVGFDPVFSRPLIARGANEPEPVFGDVVFPTALQKIGTFVAPTPGGPQARQRLVLIPAQYFSIGAGTGVERLFTSVNALVYYSNSTDLTPPTLGRVDAATTDSVVNFMVEATDDSPASVERVLVVFREVWPEPSSNWRSLDLVRMPGTDRWTGSAPLIHGGEVEFFAQAVDSAGNVAVAANKGRLHEPRPLPPGVTVTVEGEQDESGWYIEEAKVTITGGADVRFAVSVDDQPFVQYVEPFTITGPGIHPVDLHGSDGSAGTLVVPIVDACVASTGRYQGCPAGDKNLVELHIVDQRPPSQRTACDDGAGSCKESITGARIKVFDRDKLNGLSITTLDGDLVTLTKNPNGSLYDDIYESGEADASALAAPLGCATVNGSCVAGEESTGDYLAIVKWIDLETWREAYTGKPKSPQDFVDTDGDGSGDLASKDFQILKVIKKDGTIQYSGGSKTVVRGSYLEIVYPDYAVWEDVTAGYVYPFIFTSDSDWTVDVCAQVPGGYEIVGVYDEKGDLLPDSQCHQTFVSGETRVVAFEVVETGSPEPHLSVGLTVQGPHGNVKTLEVEVPGVRRTPELEVPGVWGTGGPEPALLAGWNHHLYVGPSAPIEEALASIIGDVRVVYRLQPDRTFDRWFPDRPDLSTIQSVHPYEPLFILMATPATWNQELAVAQPTTVDLLPGWNSVCYTGESEDVTLAMDGARGEVGVVYALAGDRTWERFIPRRPELSNLDRLDQFDCVLVLVTADRGVEWVFDV